VRLNQYVSLATGLSRRAADAEISSGRVSIDGSVAPLGTKVPPGSIVTLDNVTLKLPTESVYIMLNKPVGYVSSRLRQGEDPTIYDLLPKDFERLKPAGRLDLDSSGLMLLSNNGHFIQHYTHPSGEKVKTYNLILTKPLTESDATALTRGVKLEDGFSHLRVERVSGTKATVSLSEGRNRQIRRTLGALGYGITALHRTAIGPYQLGSLAPGKWQTVSGDLA
jgi:pseudouridine synthase